jgi:hypothetical protein
MKEINTSAQAFVYSGGAFSPLMIVLPLALFGLLPPLLLVPPDALEWSRSEAEEGNGNNTANDPLPREVDICGDRTSTSNLQTPMLVRIMSILCSIGSEHCGEVEIFRLLRLLQILALLAPALLPLSAPPMATTVLLAMILINSVCAFWLATWAFWFAMRRWWM